MRLHGGERRGQSLVEFALVLLPLLMLLIGIIDVGRAIYGFNTVANASREAARYAIVDQSALEVVQTALDSAAALDLDATDVAFTTCAAKFCQVSVTVSWDYTPVTPLIGDLFNPTISSTTSMPVEVVNP
jgi:Flp pilus assembly protein TadG